MRIYSCTHFQENETVITRLSNHMLSDGFDEKYVKMFREEMENFRLLFIEWAKEISKMEKDVEDEWGLF